MAENEVTEDNANGQGDGGAAPETTGAGSDGALNAGQDGGAGSDGDGGGSDDGEDGEGGEGDGAGSDDGEGSDKPALSVVEGAGVKGDGAAEEAQPEQAQEVAFLEHGTADTVKPIYSLQNSETGMFKEKIDAVEFPTGILVKWNNLVCFVPGVKLRELSDKSFTPVV